MVNIFSFLAVTTTHAEKRLFSRETPCAYCGLNNVRERSGAILGILDHCTINPVWWKLKSSRDDCKC